MEVVLLGTGAADGWPNAFCRCDSCRDAATTGRRRGHTSALIDRTLLVDCGPEVPAAAVRLGRTLADVTRLLITHAHVDHLGPQALLFRSWARPGEDQPIGELEIIGPPEAIDECRPWVGPDDPIRFTPVVAGAAITAGGYTIRVLPARHRVFTDGDAVLYDITGPDAGRILWAADTGVWPDDWFDAVADARYDAVFLEETFGYREELSDGHLGFAGFTTMTERLRDVGAITAATDVVAVHLGHHNPPESLLHAELRRCGARPGVDGQVIELG